MLSLHRIPRPPLSELVECLWYWEGAPTNHTYERLLPNGESAIIINLREGPLRIYDARDVRHYNDYGHAVLSGARSDCFVIDTNQQECVIGVQFKPGGAFPFFRVPASEVEGSSVALADLWPKRVGEIRERLLVASSPDAMFTVLERSLMEQLVRSPELLPSCKPSVTGRRPTAKSGCSPSTFCTQQMRRWARPRFIV